MVVRKKKKLTGPASLFRKKVRAPVSLTMTKQHHAVLRRAMRRLGLTRADVLALLIDKYGDIVQLPTKEK